MFWWLQRNCAGGGAKYVCGKMNSVRVAREFRYGLRCCMSTKTNEIKNEKLLLALHVGCRAYIEIGVHMYTAVLA